MSRLAGCIDRGLQAVAEQQGGVRGQVKELKRIARTLDPQAGSVARRREQFVRLKRRLGKSKDPLLLRMAAVMASFVAGLFAGPQVEGGLVDNQELERWFRLPKGHQRRIHGRKHAGVRLVQLGATLMPVLDAHAGREEPFTAEQLLEYRSAQPPPEEQAAVARAKVMRRARSRKRRGDLLAELERRYRDAR